MSESATVSSQDQGAALHQLCLVSMPFSSLQHPGLGMSLLAQLARDNGFATTEKYFSFDYAEAIGLDEYFMLSDGRCYQALLGEWIFSDLIYPRSDLDAMDYLTTVLGDYVSGVEWLAFMQNAIAARKQAGAFVERCADAVMEQNPTVIGITSSFQQVMASIALARAVRKRSADVIIVMGGANCEGPLGRALLQAHPELDAVCIGEGDYAFPEFLKALGPSRPLPVVEGFLNQSQLDNPLEESRPRLTTDLDTLPIPDFNAFFKQFQSTTGLSTRLVPSATIETSRGCWWGAKHHCTFCGLNGQSMTYRSKSAERAYAEFCTLADLYGPDLVVVDNILDHRYLKTLIPKLAQDTRPFLMHYEVKSNLSPTVIARLADAGVRKIQPGIETFDTPTLAHMRKGVSGIQNIQTLKLCAEAGVFVEWCFLYGFPGELPEAFERMAKLIPLLHHLQPPGSIGPVRADRFSPYFEHPEAFGVEVEPAKPYSFIFDLPPEEVWNFAYHFDIVDNGPSPPAQRAASTLDALAAWQNEAGTSALYVEGDTVIDLRASGQRVVHQLDETARAILDLSPVIIGRALLGDQVSDLYGVDAFDSAMDRLEKLGLIYVEDKSVLSLALRSPGFQRAPTWSEIRNAPERAFAAQFPSEFTSAQVSGPQPAE